MVRHTGVATVNSQRGLTVGLGLVHDSRTHGQKSPDRGYPCPWIMRIILCGQLSFADFSPQSQKVNFRRALAVYSKSFGR